MSDIGFFGALRVPRYHSQASFTPRECRRMVSDQRHKASSQLVRDQTGVLSICRIFWGCRQRSFLGLLLRLPPTCWWGFRCKSGTGLCCMASPGFPLYPPARKQLIIFQLFRQCLFAVQIAVPGKS